MKFRDLAVIVVGALSACRSSAPEAGETRDASPGRQTLRVALCQIEVDGDREAALERMEAACMRAVELGAHIACFPETCLFGWVNPLAHRQADPIPGPTTDRLGDMAQRHGLMLGVGLAEAAGEQLFDSAVLIDRDGSVLLRHRKVNVLSELMSPAYATGGDAMGSVVETRLGRIGMLICADTFLDDVVSQVAEQDPDLVLVPYGWAAPAESWPEHGASLHGWIGHTAKRVGAPVVGVDATGALGHGPWAGYVLGGQSAASSSAGVLSPPLADRSPEVRVVEYRAR